MQYIKMEDVKSTLIGQTIQDVGLVNRSGVKTAKVTLADGGTLFVPLVDVNITVSAQRKPMGTSNSRAALVA